MGGHAGMKSDLLDVGPDLALANVSRPKLVIKGSGPEKGGEGLGRQRHSAALPYPELMAMAALS